MRRIPLAGDGGVPHSAVVHPSAIPPKLPRPMRPLFTLALLAIAGCAPAAGARPGTPDATTDRWKGLVGCYQMNEVQFVLDSVPETRLYSGAPGVRRARFAPEPAIVGAYWFINEKGALWVARHDGLWGTSYDFRVSGDSLVGVRWVGTDVPGRGDPPTPAVAVRTSSCPPEPEAGGSGE